MNKKISFIYFDIGGVLISDLSKTNEWDEIVSSWNIPNQRVNDVNVRFDEFEKEVNVGRDTDEFLPILKEEFGIRLGNDYSLLTDIIDRFKKNEGIEKILKEGEDKYGMGLLTNMYPGMFEGISKKKIMPVIDWEVILDSSKVRLKKPEPEIYEIAQKKSGVRAEEILFIDNVPEVEINL